MSKFKLYLKKVNDRLLYDPTNVEFLKNAPSQVFRPLEYQKWKIIGKYLDFLTTDRIGVKKQNSFKEFIYRYSRNFGGVIGFFVLLFLVLGAFIIPSFSQDPLAIDENARFKAMFQDGHIFGTDDFGRDVWAFMWKGLQFSILLAIAVTAVDLLIGISVGLLMGRYEKFDVVMQFLIKIINSLPTIIILILVTITYGASFPILFVAMISTSWTGLANQVRASVKKIRGSEWVQASKVLGTSPFKILVNFIPAILPIIMVNLVFSIPGVVLAETQLAFIGLSVADKPTLGALLDNASRFFASYPQLVILPAGLLILLATSLQLIGNSIQDSLRRQR